MAINGTELAWLIDPQRRVVEVYRPGAQPEVHEDRSWVQGTGCVAGFELVMERVLGGEAVYFVGYAVNVKYLRLRLDGGGTGVHSAGAFLPTRLSSYKPRQK